MCGILAIIAPYGCVPDVTERHAAHMRDLMAHRGPDGAGLLLRGSAIFGHRRLAVIDPSPAGAQPFTSSDGRFSLVYNGEIYNDSELRGELEEAGVSFRTACDTETLFAALMHWGTEALYRIRGMFAFGFFDARTGVLLLARDPLGIKPLYWSRTTGLRGPEFVFASEIPPILAHPACSAAPDWGAVSAYLSTARVTTGSRTLFEGVHTLEPGHLLRLDTREATLTPSIRRWWEPVTSAVNGVDEAAAKAVMEDSVRRHLRSDVPVCTLLSGGLDSSIIAAIAAPLHGSLRSFCAFGSAGAGEVDDASAAREVAEALGLHHAEAVVTPEMFATDWRWIIDQTGLPLATPNEVAILEVARTLRKANCTVTLSGEGADEIFGGYDRTLDPASAFEASISELGIDRHSAEYAAMAARHALAVAHWVDPLAKHAVFREGVWKWTDSDRILWTTLIDRYAGEASKPFDHPLRIHLRTLRAGNLAELLRRLDSSTMLAGVEGRTPFADAAVATWAESVPIDRLFAPGEGNPTPRTKRILRSAFKSALPMVAVERSKASFPLPFGDYLAEAAATVRSSPFLREVFEPSFLERTLADPAGNIQAAWPVVNLGLWGRRFA